MNNRPKYTLPFSFYVVIVCVLIALAQITSQTATVIAQNAAVQAKYTVIIDAGHGGIDGGATSCSGEMEKNINLEIALRLDDLMHLLGISTIMIRTDDRSIHTTGETIAAKKVSDLKERVRIVNETENSILVSIHQNYFPDAQYKGAQIFYSHDNTATSLAKNLQSLFNDTLCKSSNREAKRASGIYVMENIKSPGVLIECGFLSNSEEEALLRTAEHQKKICCIVASQMCNFLEQYAIA